MKQTVEFKRGDAIRQTEAGIANISNDNLPNTQHFPINLAACALH